MNKILKGVATGALFVSSLLFFGNKPQGPVGNQPGITPTTQNFILQHAKDVIKSLDTPSALAWHESHSSHASHESHSSHYSSSY